MMREIADDDEEEQHNDDEFIVVDGYDDSTEMGHMHKWIYHLCQARTDFGMFAMERDHLSYQWMGYIVLPLRRKEKISSYVSKRISHDDKHPTNTSVRVVESQQQNRKKIKKKCSEEYDNNHERCTILNGL